MRVVIFIFSSHGPLGLGALFGAFPPFAGAFKTLSCRVALYGLSFNLWGKPFTAPPSVPRCAAYLRLFYYRVCCQYPGRSFYSVPVHRLFPRICPGPSDLCWLAHPLHPLVGVCCSVWAFYRAGVLVM